MKLKFLLNPFEHIAGWQSLALGVAGMALAAWFGSVNGVAFDGALDAHLRVHTFPEALLMQAVALVSLFLFMYLAAVVFSKSKPRAIDIAGTMAFARLPETLMAALCFIPAVGNQLAVFLPAAIVCVIWMVVLMFNGYAVSSNLKGVRAGFSFTGALLLSEAASIALLLLLSTAMPAKGAAAAEVRLEQAVPRTTAQEQTIQQTAAIVMDCFDKGQWSGITACFDETMRKGLSEPQLSALWSGLKLKLGEYERATIPEDTATVDGYRVMLIPCRFSRGEIKIQMAFDDSGRICGIYLR